MSELHGLLRFRFARFRALLVKECRLILRDPSYLVIGLGLPLLMLFLYGFGISMDIRNVPADIVFEESTPAALAVARRFEANAYLSGIRSESPRKTEARFSKRETEAVVRIDSGFARSVEKGDAAIGLTLYGVDSNTAQMVRSYAEGVLGTAL
ncbi:MAG: ABC transporter permease, partial [Sutterella wadsworthensis]|nr:ABC transporter permease [Sutterella wadsworthensis]